MGIWNQWLQVFVKLKMLFCMELLGVHISLFIRSIFVWPYTQPLQNNSKLTILFHFFYFESNCNKEHIKWPVWTNQEKAILLMIGKILLSKIVCFQFSPFFSSFSFWLKVWSFVLGHLMPRNVKLVLGHGFFW